MRFRRLAAASCCVAFGAGAVHTALAQPARPRSASDHALPARSIGSPTDGSLVGGVALQARAELRLRWPDGPRWALPTLVSMLEHAARRVDVRYPGSILLVGDLSRRDGGSLSGHASHESGRDADVGFYYADPQGRAVRTERLLPVRASGSVPAAGHLRFDEARNWALVEAFLTDADVIVQHIFVAEPLKRRLLDYARQHRAGSDVLDRAEAAMRQPVRGSPHDDHFHVRIACPPEQANVCIPDPMPHLGRERTASLAPTER